MRSYLLTLLLAILFSSCATNHVVIGEANNAKDGASIRTSNGLYIIDNLSSWHDSINTKKIKAWVKIKRKSTTTKEDLYDSKTGAHKQGRIGTTITVRLKKIELLKEQS